MKKKRSRRNKGYVLRIAQAQRLQRISHAKRPRTRSDRLAVELTSRRNPPSTGHEQTKNNINH